MATECLRTGGAQIFALRLAKALTDERHIVYSYYNYAHLINHGIVERNYPSAQLIAPDIPFDWLIRKWDRLIYKLGIDFSFRNIFVRRHQRQTIQQLQPDVVHSHMFQSDHLWSQTLEQFPKIRLIVTLHGSYETFMQLALIKGPERILNYQVKLHRHLQRVNGLAYLTAKNLDVFTKGYVKQSDYPALQMEKIYNGFPEPAPFTPKTKADLDLSEGAFVYGMVARGIPEKGWEVAIQAFEQLNNSDAHLVLIGWSDYVAQLASQNTNANIHFLGQQANPLEWIRMFDVGLLPSSYGESLPNVIVEYLYCNKPVIATDIGESREMITCGNGLMGYIIAKK